MGLFSLLFSLLERRILEAAAARISSLLFSAEPLVSVFLRSLGREGVGLDGISGGARVSLKEVAAAVLVFASGTSGCEIDLFDGGTSTEVNLGVLDFKDLELIPLELAEPALRGIERPGCCLLFTPLRSGLFLLPFLFSIAVDC